MANIVDGRCRCPEFQVTEKGKSKPCEVPGHPDENKRPTPEQKK